MASRVPPIARVRLARSVGRLLRPTLILLLLGAAVASVGLLAPFELPIAARALVVAVGALVALAGLRLGIRMLSVRLDVEEAALRLHWLGGERIYALTPGPVTRVRLEGEHASSLRAGSRFLGWSFGRAVLRDEEPIEVVRLAPTATVILVPTERGRFAIAPQNEAHLLDALARAAQARQRLEELAGAPAVPPRDEGRAAAAVEAEDAGDERPVHAGAGAPLGAAMPVPEPEPAPRLLTGIERAMLEAERARQQAEADARAAAEAERRTDGEAAAGVDPSAEDVNAAPGMPVAEREPAPSRSAGKRSGPSRRAVTVAASVVTPATTPAATDPVVRPPRARRRFAVGRPSVALVLLPLVASAAVWGMATLVDRLPEEGTDLARIASLGLVLSGPATSVGAVMARVWWPRLVGVVVAGGLVATAFIGRALVGPLN